MVERKEIVELVMLSAGATRLGFFTMLSWIRQM